MKFLMHFFRFILSIYDLPFRLLCKHYGKNSYIGLGYSILFSDKSGVSIGNNVSIGTNAAIQTVPNPLCEDPVLTIGDKTMIGRDFFASAAEEIRIGKNCLFSWRVTILDHDHNFNKFNIPIVEQGISKGKSVIIGDNTFVGIGVVILKGVTLGKHCVIGANSIVTKSFPDNSIIAGCPAVKIGEVKLER